MPCQIKPIWNKDYVKTITTKVLRMLTIEIRLFAPTNQGTCWMDLVKMHLETSWIYYYNKLNVSLEMRLNSCSEVNLCLHDAYVSKPL